MKKLNKELKSLKLPDWAEIIIETDEKNPSPLVRITPGDSDTPFDIIDSNIRVRLVPKYE